MKRVLVSHEIMVLGKNIAPYQQERKRRFSFYIQNMHNKSFIAIQGKLKVASYLGLGGGFRRVHRFPPLLTNG